MKFKKIISALAAVSMLSSVFVVNAFAEINKDNPVVMDLSYTEKDISSDASLKKFASKYNAYEISVDLSNAPSTYDPDTGDGYGITYMQFILQSTEGYSAKKNTGDWWIDGGSAGKESNLFAYQASSADSPLYFDKAELGDNLKGVLTATLLVKKTITNIKFTPVSPSVVVLPFTGDEAGSASDAIEYKTSDNTIKFGTETAAGFQIGEPTPTVKLSKVEITSTATEVVDGQTLALTAKAVNDDNSENKTATLAWTSSKEDVATVEGGVVTAKKPGTTTISVTATDGTDTATANIDITVTKAPAILNSLNVTGADTVVEGETITLGYDAKDQYGDEFTATKTEWTSSKEEIATVDENGVVTGVAAGTARITLKVNGSIEAFKDVTVTAKPVVNPVITINGLTGFVDGTAVTAGEEKGFVWTPVVISNYNSKAGTYTATFKAEGTPDKTAVLKGLPAIEGNPTVTFAVILRTIKTGVKLGIDFAE